MRSYCEGTCGFSNGLRKIQQRKKKSVKRKDWMNKVEKKSNKYKEKSTV